MFQSSVVSSREYQVGQPKLVDSMKALHLRAFQQLEEDSLYLDATVYAVVDDLGAGHG
jgi:hypothetical protein